MQKLPLISTRWLVALAAAIPLGAWLCLPLLPPLRTLELRYAGGGTRFADSTLPLARVALGSTSDPRPLIANVQIVDFDDDGLPDVLACDAKRQAVVWIRQGPAGQFTESVVAEEISAPAHVTVADLDRDGQTDLLVSVLGDFLPNDTRVGRLLWLQHAGDGWIRHVLLDQVRRVADCQPADFDNDGDLDLAVAVFGYARGEVLWLENRGQGRFREHQLLSAPGAIHVPVADFDGDGDFDLATVISQNEEEVWGFENLGGGRFLPRRLWFTINFDIGSAGLVGDDLDRDGDTDLILPVGDNLEIAHSFPQPYHGCFWFENTGGWNFAARRIARFGATYAAAAGDPDGDGDRDVVLVSMGNNPERADNPSIVWLENDGRQQFNCQQIDTTPTHLITVACGDLNGDGRDDIVAGGVHLTGPFDRVGRVTAWLSHSGPRKQ
jgi:hypothetical protein